MSQPKPPSGPDRTYQTIEDALAGSARGRWFLAEHLRRSRADERHRLLDAVARIEAAMSGRGAEPGARRLRDEETGVARLRDELAEMSGAIARMKGEVAGLSGVGQDRQHPRSDGAAGGPSLLDGVVRTTEKATSDILDATELVQETAWTMRENGFDPALCDALDERATEIYAACEFQDLTAQRLGPVMRTLGYLETRIEAMTQAWGSNAPAAPPVRPAELHLSQDDIDFVLVDPPEAADEVRTRLGTREAPPRLA